MSLDSIKTALEKELLNTQGDAREETARHIVSECKDIIASLRRKGISWNRITEIINNNTEKTTPIKMMTIKTYYFNMVKNGETVQGRDNISRDKTRETKRGEIEEQKDIVSSLPEETKGNTDLRIVPDIYRPPKPEEERRGVVNKRMGFESLVKKRN